MKTLLLCASLLFVAVPASSHADVTAPAAHAHRHALVVDDPRPEPIECPMCSGNATVHARRLIVLSETFHSLALRLLAW